MDNEHAPDLALYPCGIRYRPSNEYDRLRSSVAGFDYPAREDSPVGVVGTIGAWLHRHRGRCLWCMFGAGTAVGCVSVWLGWFPVTILVDAWPLH